MNLKIIRLIECRRVTFIFIKFTLHLYYSGHIMLQYTVTDSIT